MNVGFIGLGNMGYNISINLKKKFNTYIWNRTVKKSMDHSLKYNTIAVKNVNDIAIKCDVILLCLPTFNEVNDIIEQILPDLKSKQYIIDCTSSDAFFQKNIYDRLLKNNIYYFDAPVSGGPEKALLGTLCCMVGGNKDKFEDIKHVLNTFSNPIYVGEIGNACAIKSINNILNVTHLCLASEALQALNDYGVDKKIALSVINKSSGRSLMTEERIPHHIMEKNYNYGFSLGLMNKDVNLALKLIKNPIMFSNTSNVLKKALDKYGYNADYTEVSKELMKK